MSKTYTNPETIGLHAGWRKDENTHSVAVQIHQPTSFQFDNTNRRTTLRNSSPAKISYPVFCLKKETPKTR